MVLALRHHRSAGLGRATPVARIVDVDRGARRTMVDALPGARPYGCPGRRSGLRPDPLPVGLHRSNVGASVALGRVAVAGGADPPGRAPGRVAPSRPLRPRHLLGRRRERGLAGARRHRSVGGADRRGPAQPPRTSGHGRCRGAHRCLHPADLPMVAGRPARTGWLRNPGVAGHREPADRGRAVLTRRCPARAGKLVLLRP